MNYIKVFNIFFNKKRYMYIKNALSQRFEVVSNIRIDLTNH